MPSSGIQQSADALVASCRHNRLKLAVAESCTGGLLAGLLTAVPGASEVFERGFVTYSNAAKVEMLGVSEALLHEHGAVSEACALAMAEGALARSRADLAVAITGIAGPGGGTPTKPVGLVHIACAQRGFATRHARHLFPGDREAIRLAAIEAALEALKNQAGLGP